MSVSTSGFALRINGTCPGNNVDCGATVAPYRVCCPENSFCPSQYNINCCPTSANCTSILLQNPQCANQSWNLYDNRGYFCCEKGLIGYASTTDSDGCASPGYAFQSGEVALRIVSTGIVSSSSATSTSTSTSSTSTPTPTTPSLAKKSNTGPIVGGVMGGVVVTIVIAALIWFVMRRKRSKKTNAPIAEFVELHHKDDRDFKKPSELGSQHGVSELAGGHRRDGRPSELWAPHAGNELGG